jgi:hypothetical protein
MKHRSSNKRVRCALLWASATVLTLATPAMAIDVNSILGDINPQPYVQASLGQMRLDSASHSGVNLRATVGVNVTRHFGAELTYFQLPSVDVANGTYKGSAYVASMTGSLALPMDVTLVGRLGLGKSSIDLSHPSTNYASSSSRKPTVWGIGIRYPLKPSIDMTMDYDNLGTIGRYATGTKVKASTLSIGARYKF